MLSNGWNQTKNPACVQGLYFTWVTGYRYNAILLYTNIHRETFSIWNEIDDMQIEKKQWIKNIYTIFIKYFNLLKII